jgi:hypothetical protein
MTEDEARQVVLLQARESAGASSAWTAEDGSWATRQAVATVGEQAAPERFVVARAVLGLQRLLPRDGAAQRWLARRVWHPAWAVLALVLGFGVGLAVDQLGPPQRVNLLAPAVWAVVAWNLVVYAALLLPVPGLRQALARWGHRGDSDLATVWARHAAPLTLERLALLLHAASAALALGLIGGLYLRGLVLDYRAGWQSTFLDAGAVQTLLGTLLAPASALTGIVLPDVAPLRVGPDGVASATAAPWIHLYASTLALFVVLPRGLLALRAGWRSRRLSQRFPLPLDTPYFEALHPLMQPGLPRAVRLLWACDLPRVCLFDTDVAWPAAWPAAPLTLLRNDEGDELQLLPLPAALRDSTAAAAGASGWRRWFGVASLQQQLLARLRETVDAVLLVTAAQAPRPSWLAALGRPVVVLVDGAAAAPQPLALGALADGWLPDGRLLQALVTALPGDLRLRRLAASWQARQHQRFEAGVAELAASLGRIASAREAVADEGLLARRGVSETARTALADRLDSELRDSAMRLLALLGLPAADTAAAPLPAAAALRSRVGEGRAALMGGVVTGALAGLKADLLSGGMTMGAGMVAGGLIGALGGAGVARGLNVVRGTDRSYLAWNEEALVSITEALLLRHLLWLAPGLAAEQAGERLAGALAPEKPALAALWRGRQRRFDNAGEAASLAQALQPLLVVVLKRALGGPA